jgi:hypothetical protein
MNQHIAWLLVISAITWGCEEAVSNHDGPSPAYYGPCGAAVPDGGLLKHFATPDPVLGAEQLEISAASTAALTVHNAGLGNLLIIHLRVEPEAAYAVTWTYAEHPEYGPTYEPICVDRDAEVQILVTHIGDGAPPDGQLSFRTNHAELAQAEVPITGLE